jgi:hypothetical protein
VWLGIDADAAQLVGSCHGGRAVARAVRQAADDAYRPSRRSLRVRKDRDGGHPDLPQRLAGAVPDRSELATPLGYRVGDGCGLGREHRRLGRVREHLGARRRRHQSLDHRAPGPREWGRETVTP